MGGEVLAGLDPVGLGKALMKTLVRPKALVRESARLAVEQAKIAAGRTNGDTFGRDPRFADPTWRDHPVYRRVGQAYLAWDQALTRVVEDADVDWRTAERARFAKSVLTSAAAPTNFFFGNPAAIKRAFETGGVSVVRGMRHFVQDLRDNGGLPAQVDRRPFAVGQKMAVTPGAVVYRNDVCEVIQYAPSTPDVSARPVVMVPPQINKYYFMDLAPKRSFTEYAVSRGLQFFTVSWRNPGPDQRDWNLDTYIESALVAIDVAREITKSDDVNLLALCAGGITSALMLGWLAATGDARVASASFAVTTLDFDVPSMLGMFADKRLVQLGKRRSQKGGIMKGNDLARTFAWMRPNDLVWNYWVNNYLLGNDPPAFDILAWNADATNLPAALHSDFLSIFQQNSIRQPGAVEVFSRPVDVRDVDLPTYVVGGKTDHLTPWEACYQTTQLLSGESRFVLTGTGHIQSLINPPGNPKARLWMGPDPGPDPHAWLAKSQEHRGATWWTDWADWILPRSGETKRAPAKLGSNRHRESTPAPGTYIYTPA
jgi:polyhydroxyalkanoate synthase subunit PhaC